MASNGTRSILCSNSRHNRPGHPSRVDHAVFVYRSMLQEIQKPGEIVFHRKAQGSGLWQVVVAGMDQPGILSIISGLLTAYGCDIANGDIFTFTEAADTPPTPAKHRPYKSGVQRTRQPTRKVLDILDVTLPTDSAQTDFWSRFETELKRLIQETHAGHLEQVREEIIERISANIASLQQSDERLLPIQIEFDNQTCEDLTGLHIFSADTQGFLFSFTNGLSMLGFNIVQAEVRTCGDEVRDSFWIQDLRRRKITDTQKLQELRTVCALIKHFTYLLPLSANPGQALRQFIDFATLLVTRPERTGDFESIQSIDVMHTIAELMGVSKFLWEDFLRMQHENLFPLISGAENLNSVRNRGDLVGFLESALSSADEDTEKVSILNDFKDREMFRIDLRHITRRSDDPQFSQELTDLTDVVLQQALDICGFSLENRFGRPMTEDNRPCRWSVMAAGKYGGREMGYASDIELIFVYEAAGHTDADDPIANARFFEEWVRSFLKTLKSKQEGIFQIDLRLRPYGAKGTLACSLDSFRSYYAVDGPAQQFERLALTKLRAASGDAALGREILGIRDAFVYSGRPLDLDNIRHLRRRQAAELVKPKTVNAKFSPGGLADIEYFVQARQILYGAENPSLRVTHTVAALQHLAAAGAIDRNFAEEITSAYQLLRRLIDALRAVRGNARDLGIPSADSRAFRYLSRRMGYDSTEKLENELHRSMALSRSLWNRPGGPKMSL